MTTDEAELLSSALGSLINEHSYTTLERVRQMVDDRLTNHYYFEHPAPAPDNGTTTSAMAAAQVGDRRPIRLRILGLIEERGPMTCGEIEQHLVGSATHQGVSARIRELTKDGLLADTGQTRANPVTRRQARVYRINQQPTMGNCPQPLEGATNNDRNN